MSGRKRRTAVLSALVVGAVALLAPSAQASITPTLTLDQSAGTQAGGTENLGMDLTFGPANPIVVTDSPDVMTINLPPGLLANASIDGGACLTTTDLSDTNCQVGTGSVTAYPAGVLVPLTVDVTFDLVPPPAPGDLAGLAVNMDDQQIGSTAGIKVRPSGDPDGVGITIDFVLPNSLDGAPIDITEIDSTFDGLRYPTSCPSTPANVGVSVDSYSDSTVHNLSAAAPRHRLFKARIRAQALCQGRQGQLRPRCECDRGRHAGGRRVPEQVAGARLRRLDTRCQSRLRELALRQRRER